MSRWSKSSLKTLHRPFPFIESLTLKGPPPDFIQAHYPDIRITPWIEQLALEFRCLKELCIRRLVAHDEDLETLTRTHGNDLRSLKIKMCKGFLTDGLRHVSKYCNQLRTLCLTYSYYDNVKDGILLHQLALNSMVKEKLHVMNMDIIYNAEDLTLLAKNYCNPLISLKIGACYLSKLGDAIRYVVRFPNLEVLYTQDIYGYRGLQVIGKFCQKLRKLTHNGLVTYAGLIALAKGCTKLECLDVTLKDISNEAMECVRTHLKNLRDFHIWLSREDDIKILPLDYGVRAMLIGCSKLERLDISHLWHGGLTYVGLEYIGSYGANLRSLSLTRIG
ncbi:leucine-rich repeat, cysteine-containing subtype protein, partial [Tanacetum coccineum]